MSILGKVSSGLRVLGYSFVPVAGDGVVKLARLVATKVLTKNDPFQMRQWEVGDQYAFRCSPHLEAPRHAHSGCSHLRGI